MSMKLVCIAIFIFISQLNKHWEQVHELLAIPIISCEVINQIFCLFILIMFLFLLLSCILEIEILSEICLSDIFSLYVAYHFIFWRMSFEIWKCLNFEESTITSPYIFSAFSVLSIIFAYIKVTKVSLDVVYLWIYF